MIIVLLEFDPSEAIQIDWGEATVYLQGKKTKINLWCMRECHSADIFCQAYRKAGVKGYVTDLRIPAQEVIDAYHHLFQVEKSFRMSKSDLKARPIFHHKRESIDAHLTVVFASLAIARYIEAATGLSIKKFINVLTPIRTGVITVNGVSLSINPLIPDDITLLLKQLKL